jgi:hypothetical protein
VLAAAIGWLGAFGAWAQQGRQTEADVWGAAGNVAIPGIRAAMADELRVWQEARKVEAAERARLLGLTVREARPDGGLRELMAWEGEKPLYYATCNANAAISTGSSLIRVLPYAADGAGWTVGVWDGGAVRATHQEFGGRVTVMDGAAFVNHSTHVGGTIGATGVTASAMGMARAARIDSYDWNSDASETTSRGASYGGEAGKIYISNHSYGFLSGWYYTGGTFPAWEWYGAGTTAAAYESDFGKYEAYARDVDTRAFNLPYYSIFWAAGNERSDNPASGAKVSLSPGGAVVDYDPALHPPGDNTYRGGYDTISFHALAKNVVTIGAVNDAVTSGVRDLSKAGMTSFSSWGPADDGRIKPDLVANGYSLYSTSSGGDASYTYMSGTSMATPNAAGTAQQLLSFYGLFFPGQYLRASTLKGLLIHTADDLGTPGPDYRFGWGLVNAKAAADLILSAATNPAALRLVEQQITTSATTRTHVFQWDGVSPIRATLCWTDPAGASTTSHDSRTARLVNNLNLRVIGPTGTLHLPYVMPFVGAWTLDSMSAAATTGTNNTDTVEQVLIAAPPAAGSYQAVVSYAGSLANNQQNYSLLISGSAWLSPRPLSVTPGAAASGVTALTIGGESFVAGATVRFEREGFSDVPAGVSNVTASAITCALDVTGMEAGNWTVRVTNPDGKSGTLSGAFAVVETLFEQNLDAAAPGWTAYLTLGTGGSGWALSSASYHTASTAYRILCPSSKKTDNLQSQGVPVSPTAQWLRLHFWHAYNTEVYDGCVLEVSPDNATNWYAVGAAGSGATFVQGAYASAIQGRSGNPNNRAEMVGQSAWNGAGGAAFTEVVVALDPATYGGKTLRVRWRLSTDASNDAGTWYWAVDSMRISGYDTANAAPSITSAASADPATVTGLTTELSVSADDDAGESALTYTWEADGAPGSVTFSANGSNAAKQTGAAFSAPGAYGFVVTVRDAEGLTATSAVPVSVQATPVAILVSPAEAEVEAGRTLAFGAIAYDQFGVTMAPQPAFAWSVSGGGVIDANGLFAAGGTAGGPHTVTAAAQGVEGTAQVTVVARPLTGTRILVY